MHFLETETAVEKYCSTPDFNRVAMKSFNFPTTMKKILLTTAIVGFALTLNAQTTSSEETRRAADDTRLELRKSPHHHAFHGKHDVHKEGMHKRKPLDAQTMAVKKSLRLKEDLLLSDKQFDEVYKLYYERFKDFEKKMSAKKTAGDSPRDEAAKEARRAERKETHAKLNAELEKPMKKILNDEQFKRWQELESDHANRMPQDGAKRVSDRPFGPKGA